MVRSAVQVYIRTKPTDKFAYDGLVLSEDRQTVSLHVKKALKDSNGPNNQQGDYHFKYDGILHNSTQEQVYQQCAQSLVKSVLDGYNGTILTYGQTGAGKTFTMSGGSDFRTRGIIPRLVSDMFAAIANKPEQSFEVKISYMEIYNEKIYDLLTEYNSGSLDLAIQEDTKGVISVKNLTTKVVQQESDALSLFFEGNTNRAIAEHQMNAGSSRSHCIFSLYVSCRSRVESDGHTTYSKLHCVDLAGSERLSKTGSEGAIMREAMYINKSLSFLEQVVVALASSNRDHVPYRQCKLTNVLKDSLGGNCWTVMIANVWPEVNHMEETASTLKFASRMMKVQNEVSVNSTLDPEGQIRKMAKEIAELKSELQMQNQLHGKSHISYEEFGDEERYELQKQVRAYIDGTLTDLEVKSLRQTKEIFRIFRSLVEAAEAEGSKNPRSQNASLASPVGKAGANTFSNGVGDVEAAGGFGIGVGIPAKMETLRNSIAPIGTKMDVNNMPSPLVSVPSGMYNKLGPNSPGSVTPANAANAVVQLPDRNQAFDHYKLSAGLELSEQLKRYQQDLREKKRIVRELANKLNAIKGQIDILKNSVEMKREANEGADDDVVDAEYFQALQALKQQKSNYRQLHEELNELQTSRDQQSRLVDLTRENLIKEFTTWYETTYGSNSSHMPPLVRGSSLTGNAKGSIRSINAHFMNTEDEVLDEGEKFDNLQLQRIMAQDPESTAYYSAQKNAMSNTRNGGTRRNARRRLPAAAR